MSNIQEHINSLRTKSNQGEKDRFSLPPTPRLFNTHDEDFTAEFESFLQNTQIFKVIDTYESQLLELFHIRFPHIKEESKEAESSFGEFKQKHLDMAKSLEECGVWVYYPWTKYLVHFLEKEMYQEIRTARNKLLITSEEEKKFRNFVSGVCGLSIGNSVALSIAYSSGCEIMKLADPDVFSASNLNRVRIPAYYVGVKKVYVAAQQIYEINPFAKLILYENGITPENLHDFLFGEYPLQVLIEEMDSLKMKLFIRLAARNAGIPVLMTTDNGDDAIIDVDRFDIMPDKPPYKTLPPVELKAVTEGLMFGEPFSLSDRERAKFATKLVGPDAIVPRMQESLMEVGSTLASWPQLGTAAFLGGAVIAYLTRRLALGEEVKDGKSFISLDQLLLADEQSDEKLTYRQKMNDAIANYITEDHYLQKENYRSWSVKASDFPYQGSIKEQLRFLLNYAILAPSSHNTQPWRFHIEGDNIYLLGDEKRQLEFSDPTGREYFVSLGACLANLIFAAEAFGFKSSLDYFPNSDKKTVAKIILEGKAQKIVDSSIDLITNRSSDRGFYNGQPLPERFVQDLKKLEAEYLGIEVHLSTDNKSKSEVAELAANGTELALENESFRKELAGWIRHNYTNLYDGMPGNTLNLDDMSSVLGPFLMFNFNLSKGHAKHDQEVIESSAAGVTICLDEDTPDYWVKAGKLYEEILLLATKYNLRSGTLAAPVELPPLKEKMKVILHTEKTPVCFFRIGFSKQEKVPHSPRIPLELLLD